MHLYDDELRGEAGKIRQQYLQKLRDRAAEEETTRPDFLRGTAPGPFRTIGKLEVPADLPPQHEFWFRGLAVGLGVGGFVMGLFGYYEGFKHGAQAGIQAENQRLDAEIKTAMGLEE
jgi:hypothetical protein